MNLKSLFSRKSSQPAPRSEPTREHAPASRLDLDALDACVGGRAETDGVGCYARTVQQRVH